MIFLVEEDISRVKINHISYIDYSVTSPFGTNVPFYCSSQLEPNPYPKNLVSTFDQGMLGFLMYLSFSPIAANEIFWISVFRLCRDRTLRSTNDKGFQRGTVMSADFFDRIWPTREISTYPIS
jgi:hypothetical protein